MPLPPNLDPKHFVNVWQESPNPTAPYSSKQTAAHSIKEGLEQAAAYRAQFPADQVNVTVYGDKGLGQRCTYSEHVKVPCGGIDLMGSGSPIIDGQGTGRCVTFKPDQVDCCWLRGFEITNGHAPDPGGEPGDNGGGVFAKDSPVVIAGNCVHGNLAKAAGGGVYLGYTEWIYYTRRSFVVSNQIYENQAQYGGGIGLEGDSFPSMFSWPEAVVFVHSNRIIANKANQGGKYRYGGGISVWRMPADIAGNEIAGNRADSAAGEAYGGGICVFNEDFGHAVGEAGAFLSLVGDAQYTLLSVQVSLNSNDIHDNSAYKGGGVAGFWFAVFRLKRNRLAGNRAEKNGGGIYLTGGCIGHFQEENFLYRNLALGNITWAGEDGCGGGIHASCRSELRFFGANNKFLENQAFTLGGGICVRHADITAYPGCLALVQNKAMGRPGPSAEKGGGLCSVINSTIYQPCVQNNSVHLEGVLVEGNSSSNGGAGMYIEKDLIVTGETQGTVFLENCVIRGNQHTGAGPAGALEIRRLNEPCVPIRMNVRSCLIEDHAGVGVLIEDREGETALSGNVIRKNNVGAIIRGDTVKIHSNFFDSNRSVQLQVDAGQPIEVKGNRLDGGGISALGIQAIGGSGASPLSIEKNDIVGHQTGADAASAAVMAPENWWGNAGGPGVGGANPVSGSVDAKPWRAKPWGYAINAPPALPMPGNLALPTPVTAQCTGVPALPETTQNPPPVTLQPPEGPGHLPGG